MKCRTGIVKSSILTLCVFFNSFAISQALTVKQDGTGDFTQIQSAIDAAEVGDTILVWPGEYIENLIIVEKYLTLGSLYLTTNNDAYIDSTIINGNQSGSGIAILEVSDTTKLIGFSITNGSGYPIYNDIIQGGGVFVYNSLANIISCDIYDNIAPDGGGGLCLWFSQVKIENCRINRNFSPHAGGGISCIFDSFVLLKGTDIINNHAYYTGGGITIVGGSEVVFDSIDRCNIYLNFSGAACDVYKNNSILNKIYADTLTVSNPDNYFILSADDFGFPLNDIVIDANASKITPYDGDLYVKPSVGNNNNSGTHPDSALKTIAFAYTKMEIDSVNKNTIHLANGFYSDSANSEKFPLNIRPFVNVKGESREETILDGMYSSYLVKGNNEVSNYSFSNLTMQRGTMVDYDNVFNNTDLFGFIYLENNDIIFDSIMFKTGIGRPGHSCLGITGSNNVTISNCIFEDVKGLDVLGIGFYPGDTAYITNCIFNNIKPDYNNPDWTYGSALDVGGSLAYGAGTTVIQNSLFFNIDEASLPSTHNSLYMLNNTFVNNSLEVEETANILIRASYGNAFNCISYNNGQYPFWISHIDTINSDFSIFNSCIEGGENSFTVIQGSSLYYDETNIDTDPLFYYGSEYPYNLSDNSPCIDAGTIDIPEWIVLYEYDLAGNPRIYGETIDMGAYEWNPTVGVDEKEPIKREKLLVASPNPFTNKTSIKAIIKESADVKVDIYNNNGQCIKRLINGIVTQKTVVLFWDSKNESGNECPNGLFFVVMSLNNVVVDKIKIVKTGH